MCAAAHLWWTRKVDNFQSKLNSKQMDQICGEFMYFALESSAYSFIWKWQFYNGKFQKILMYIKSTKAASKYKGMYNRLPLTKYLTLNINLSNIAFSLPSEVNFFESWPQFNLHGIWFDSNEQKFEKSFWGSWIRTSH